MRRRWELKKLGDVCRPEKTKNPRNSMPYVGLEDIVSGTGEFVGSRAPKRVQSSTFRFTDNHVLYGRLRPYLNKVFLPDFDGHCSTEIFPIRCSANTNRRFLYYWLSMEKTVAEISLTSTGARMPRANMNAVLNFPFPLPPLAEQQRIVAILDEAFAGLATATVNAEKNLKNARALFDSYLNSVFARKDEGWTRSSLFSVLSAQPRNGWSPPAEFQTSSGNPVLTLSAVTGFDYDGSRVKLSSAPTRADAHYWLEEGELLVTRSNTQDLVGHVAIYDGTPPRAICCDLIMKMKVDPANALTRFVYYFFRSAVARAYLTSRAHGASSTMKKIGKRVVQSMPIPLPSLFEQSSVVAKLDQFREAAGRLESTYQDRLRAIAELKQSILQKAFAGELTSPPSSVLAEAAE